MCELGWGNVSPIEDKCLIGNLRLLEGSVVGPCKNLRVEVQLLMLYDVNRFAVTGLKPWFPRRKRKL